MADGVSNMGHLRTVDKRRVRFLKSAITGRRSGQGVPAGDFSGYPVAVQCRAAGRATAACVARISSPRQRLGTSWPPHPSPGQLAFRSTASQPSIGRTRAPPIRLSQQSASSSSREIGFALAAGASSRVFSLTSSGCRLINLLPDVDLAVLDELLGAISHPDALLGAYGAGWRQEELESPKARRPC